MPDNQSFNIGDLVRLKSGGPLMTVCNAYDSQAQFTCKWFELAHGDYQDVTVPAAALKFQVFGKVP